MENNHSRRNFIKTLMTGVLMGPVVLNTQACAGGSGIPTRELGSTGARVSIIGFGGWDLGYIDEKVAIRMVREGVDEGITFFDNAWEYNSGNSETVVGKALDQEKLRDKVFLMTKVCARDYKGAKRQIEDSLRRLKTDHVDLLLHHSIQYDGDKERIIDPENGALKAVIEAKNEGKLKYIGFSGHRDPEIHLGMLNHSYDWDAVLMPLNIMDAHYKSFQNKVLPVVNERKMAALGMKSLTGGFDRISSKINVSPELCRHYSLSLPVSTLICGMQNKDEMHMMIDIARDFKPLTEEKIDELLALSDATAKTGMPERYKDPTSFYGCSYHSSVLNG
ncbi:MAG TPA: aldo/keto reductase [Prolixibacteraceae bacterium]|nr:aldo/keto reductase [Prolixibacteraceae bacterium]